MDAHTIPADCSDDRVLLACQTPNGLIYTFNGNGRDTRCMVYGSYTKGREDENGKGNIGIHSILKTMTLLMSFRISPYSLASEKRSNRQFI